MAVAFPAEDWQQSSPWGECSEEAAPAAAAGPVLGISRQAAASGEEEEADWIWIYAVGDPSVEGGRNLNLLIEGRCTAEIGVRNLFSSDIHVSMSMFCRS